MLKQLKDYICTQTESAKILRRCGFSPMRKRGRDMLLRKPYDGSFTAYLELRFISHRDYVIPTVLWSKLNRVPSTEAVMVDGLSSYEKKLETLDDREELELSLCEFGRKTNTVNLGEKEPSADRLEELYTSPEAEEAFSRLEGLGLKDWQSEEVLREWSMIDELFPNILNSTDVKYAAESTVNEILDVFSTKFIPYLDKLDSRLKDN